MKKSSAVKSEATFHIEKKMLWLEALSSNHPKRAEQNSFKLTLKSKCGHSFENMKTLVKTKVNPVDMKIGIRTFTELGNRWLLIETHNKEEIDTLNQTINELFGTELEVLTPRHSNPRLIIYKVSDELNIENAKELIMNKKSELCVEKEDITSRCLFKDKRKGNNLVKEVNSMKRMKFMGLKMILGWNMCNFDDYI